MTAMNGTTVATTKPSSRVRMPPSIAVSVLAVRAAAMPSTAAQSALLAIPGVRTRLYTGGL